MPHRSHKQIVSDPTSADDTRVRRMSTLATLTLHVRPGEIGSRSARGRRLERLLTNTKDVVTVITLRTESEVFQDDFVWMNIGSEISSVTRIHRISLDGS
jgi:hypothetical protein